MLKPSAFSYILPPNLIANQSVSPRDHSRLLTLNRQNGAIGHCRFFDLPTLLSSNDVLVLNQSKVFPARLLGCKSTGGKVEILLLHQIGSNTWSAIASPRPNVGLKLLFGQNLEGCVTQSLSSTGEITIDFNQSSAEIFTTLDLIGLTPVPPYIHSTLPEPELRRNYQTVYAKEVGSAAAPTAGLHFTDHLLDTLRDRGVTIEYLTLHVGLGTFKPLNPNNFSTSSLHSEIYQIDSQVAARLNKAKSSGKRIIAVGTTTARTLESAVDSRGVLYNLSSATDLFIYPPYRFKFIDSLITNFHLPQSSLLVLVTAFSCFPNTPHKYRRFEDTIIYNAYQQAIRQNYRFFSFGDACWIY
ncbi:MAG: tRNA preQ1(34) S-adenosylmethionine ribosyltransferase-isomerase QueA [Candidatus Shapirobacteria bacterium]|jgi:S-adenosylmethionine:tRNA ribosyltransferase-isomerase